MYGNYTVPELIPPLDAKAAHVGETQFYTSINLSINLIIVIIKAHICIHEFAFVSMFS